MVTEDEIKEAVRSIEEWQKNQANAAKNGGPQSTTGPLLQRVGGSDVVKHVVELFYKHLYADPSLIKFLHDQEMTHLRAKQSAFISWLFGPPGVPYTGKSVRIAHLRIIKQRGFSPEDFDLGMKYFADAMRELQAPEILISEVMRRITPYKDAIFTPSAGDIAEEARWAAEEAATQRAVSRKELLVAGSKPPSSSLAGASSNAIAAGNAAGAGADAQKQPLLAGIAETVTEALLEAVAVPVAAVTGSRPPSRQCPFTGGRISRPASAAVAPTAAAAVAAAQSAADADVRAALSAGLYPPVPGADEAPVAVASPVAAAAKPASRVPSAAAAAPPSVVQASPSLPPPGRSATQLEQELEALGRGADVLEAAEAVVVAEATEAMERVGVAEAEAAVLAMPAEPLLVPSGSGRQAAAVF
ncbi:hypothetical protein HXX76_003483 [Chlamydomonas incerta]|uniref:Globin n=1 Tax=Chlamydomonas incerta TaxID=51695 RepID=A0A835TN31_CHLIN|nr:hypothetical protein HXX76_003483 [Chlamydomonas incerta]|eukprot:KAG2441876.1 hypothetical protein HXX76_003483 [Chlamydomonas incerta]